MTLGAVIGEGHLAETDPGDHAANEARLFGQRLQRVERAPAHQAEVAGVERDRRVGQPVEHPVEDRRRRLLEQRFPRALAADGIDHVRPLRRHGRAHVGQEFGRVLKIGVDDQDLLARAQVEPCGQRQLVAVIARQVDRDQMRIGGGQTLHHRPAVVLRAVVDQDDLIILAHRRARRARDTRVQHVQTGGFVIAGDDDGQGRALHDAAGLATSDASVTHSRLT